MLSLSGIGEANLEKFIILKHLRERVMGSRKIGFVALAIATLLLLTACGSPSSTNSTFFKNYWKGTVNTTIVTNTTVNDIDYVPPDERTGYIIGAWNVQIFGQTKANNVPVVRGMDEIMSDYDLIIIQEIRDVSETAFPGYMEDYMPEYKYHLSPRLGRTSSKEQYAWVWNNNVVVSNFQVYPDEDDVFEREPEMATVNAGGFTFTAIVIHVKPTDAQNEIAALVDVVEYAKKEYRDEDIFIMGDMNADGVYYSGKDLNIYTEYITEVMDTTTTRTDAAYDRIYSTQKYAGITGEVDKYDDDNLPSGLAEAISDHYSVRLEMMI